MNREALRQERRRIVREMKQAARLARARAAGLIDHDKTVLDVEYEAIMQDDRQEQA